MTPRLAPLLLLTCARPAAADYGGHARAPELLKRLETEFSFSPQELDWVKTSLTAAERLPQLVERDHGHGDAGSLLRAGRRRHGRDQQQTEKAHKNRDAHPEDSR